jgi:curved DNA-binding protein CbpA
MANALAVSSSERQDVQAAADVYCFPVARMISNPFALFELEPAPAIDLAALKERFARATSESHPDKFAQSPEAERLEVEARYTALNQAYQTLIDPRARLLALYELTKGAKPSDIQRIPPGTMDLFKEVGELCRQLDEYLARKSAATGRMQRASMMSEELTLQDALTELRVKLEAFGATVDGEIAALDTRWRGGDKDLNALEAVYRKYSYLARWRQQLEEREISLMTGE